MGKNKTEKVDNDKIDVFTDIIAPMPTLLKFRSAFNIDFFYIMHLQETQPPLLFQISINDIDFCITIPYFSSSYFFPNKISQ